MSHRKRRAGEPVIREGGDGLYSWASTACRDLLGWDADELVGRPAADFIHPDDRLRATEGAYRHLRKDGGFAWVEPRWLPGEGSEPRARAGARRAARPAIAEALRAAEQRFELAFSDGQIGMALVSLDGTWLRVNPALCRIVGYAEDDLLGARIQDITHPDDLEADLDHMAADGPRRPGRATAMEKRYVRGDGQLAWVWLSVSVATDADGAPRPTSSPRSRTSPSTGARSAGCRSRPASTPRCTGSPRPWPRASARRPCGRSSRARRPGCSRSRRRS